VSDIDTPAEDSLKALDPKRPIREADVAGKWWNGKILARSRTGQSDAWRARRFGSILSREVGGFFVLDQIDIGQDAAARYRPALGKERDHAAA
jgi:hypothetical protein